MFRRLLIVLLLTVGVSHSSIAADTIYVSHLQGDLVAALRPMVSKRATDSRLVIYFDKPGVYEWSGTVEIRCHTEIIGMGAETTVLEFQHGRDRAGFKAFLDDAFINVKGSVDNPVEVGIRDVAFRIKDHDGIWWEDAAKLAVKIYHAKRVDVRRVVSRLHNAVCTNFDLRVCSNVTFEDNVIDNHNNCAASGNLWLRGATENVVIRRNQFAKHGNDELLAFFSSQTDAYHPDVYRPCQKRNIVVEGNTFIYSRDNTATTPYVNDVLVSLFTAEDNEASKVESCTYDNVRICGNTFTINAPLRRTIYINFIAADSHRNIVVEGNKMTNTAQVGVGNLSFHSDFWLHDRSGSRSDTLVLRNNTVTSSMGLQSEGSACYYHAVVYGATALLDGHRVTESVAKRNGKQSGVELLYFGDLGGTVALRNCVAKGLSMLASISAQNPVAHTTINAENNYFSGDTRIYCNNVERLDLRFEQNTFSSNDNNFFLQEFAREGTLVFNRNKVAVAPGDGYLMTHWNSTPLSQMRFERLEVTGNDLQGVDQQKWMTNLQNVGRRTVRTNRF